MRGDRLASGQKKADFAMGGAPEHEPVASGHTRVETEVPRQVFCECKDCGFLAFSALEFSDHVHEVHI
jgi:hypothetical protein